MAEAAEPNRFGLLVQFPRAAVQTEDHRFRLFGRAAVARREIARRFHQGRQLFPNRSNAGLREFLLHLIGFHYGAYMDDISVDATL